MLLKVTFSLFLSMILGSSPINNHSIQKTKNDFAFLKSIPGQIDPIKAEVTKAGFRDYTRSGSCDHNCNWFGFDCNTYRWSQKMPFEYVNGALNSRYGNIKTTGSKINSTYDLVYGWYSNDRPNFSRAFENEKKDPDQNGILALIQLLEKDKAKIERAMQNTAAYDRDMKSHFESIASFKKELESKIEEYKQSTNNETSGWPCDKDEGREANNTFDYVKNKVGEIIKNAENRKVSYNSIGKPASAILGIQLNILNQYQGIFDQLQKASKNSNPVMRQNFFNIAYQKWTNLDSYAKGELD